MAVNKVVYGNTTVIDITDTTAVASDVAQGKYFYNVSGVKTAGTATGAAEAAVDTTSTLPNGGTLHTITGVDLSQDTVDAAHLLSGYTAHNSSGTAITGSYTPSSATLITKSITANGTYNASSDNADGYSSVTVNVSGGGSVTQDANGYIVLPSTGGGGGSVQTATGTFTGSGTITETISCSFAPDLILVHGDLSNDVSLRGVVYMNIVKDMEVIAICDGSTSAYQPAVYVEGYGITGYGDSSNPHATYSNGTLTLDMVNNTSSTRFNSSVTYSYKLVKWTS